MIAYEGNHQGAPHTNSAFAHQERTPPYVYVTCNITRMQNMQTHIHANMHANKHTAGADRGMIAKGEEGEEEQEKKKGSERRRW